ncbi:MAG: RAMP superfamily CRISPR-associated protein, partial [Candidatus Caldarchaeum sp.]|nr:RAMP superfamily CRISPR-associated protein [Candidatus Caldarchaeum sp.]
MISFEVELKPLSLLTVGSPATVELWADIPFYKLNDPDKNEPVTVIPASTVKGVLRSSLTRVAESFGFRCCDTHQECKACICCELFGSSDFPSKIFVDDFVATSRTVIVSHVCLDDATGRAKERALFTVESIPPEASVFTGRIEVEDRPDLLKAALLALAALRTDRIGR